MTDLSALCLFLCGAVMVGITTWSWVCAANLDRRGLVEPVLAWGLLALAWIAGAGVLLGAVDEFGRAGFLAVHAGGWMLTVGWRWKRILNDFQSAGSFLSRWRDLLGGGTVEGRLTAGLLLVLLVLAALAARAEPIVFDALTYRLSRVGQWLQDGRIATLATDDPRLNYTPVVSDIVVAWLLGATRAGFRLAPLAQVAGGALLLGATYGLARVAGLGRRHGLGALAILLGMANVAAQFTTVQNDLFVAGVFAASYLLWHRALQRGEGSWVAGIGVGLAAGSKGTLLYLAPGALCWVGWLVWQERRSWRALLPTGATALAAGVLFVGPVGARNLATYGGPFGPREAVELHHGGPLRPGQRIEKLQLNLGTSLVQLLDPNAQPIFLQPACRAAGRILLPFLPEKEDRDVFAHYPRRAQVELVMELREPDADLASCGVVAALLFASGALAAARRRGRPGASQVLVWTAGVAVYLLCQHAVLQWHQWAFRFMVLAAPWMAVAGAWLLAQLVRRAQVAAWTIVAVSSTLVFTRVQATANQAAWQAITRPDRAFSHFVYGQWRQWAEHLDHPESSMTVALPINEPIAAFHRLPSGRRVVLAHQAAASVGTAEEFVRDRPGWVIVPLGRFMGREGRVRASVYNYFDQGAGSPSSLAAYRRLEPGEAPAPGAVGGPGRP